MNTVLYITAPSSASKGSTVSTSVLVSDISGAAEYVAVTAVFDSTQFIITPDYQLLSAYGSVSFTGSFIMPDAGVAVTFYSYYWDGSQWVFDNELSQTIQLTSAMTPTVSGFKIASYQKV